ncbi:uncharacterized protein N0V89_010420 [Didymosphaeria variabile]|uniref:NACHT domain-containing protein n=1 Tax=Didymosphaeria variabile TaxID=1932322 RepID=A0A9W9C639_9PLEO|nr:uncharacterized protein N0V89_010420 [Didymosphaeria variabile]KAJ4346491.1 hypothetical protein N0V89_010420 [Didymosphaeria variabile]
MRLLQCNDNGEFTFTKDLIGDDVVPQYAILSHTWKDGEEVTFEELNNGTGKEKQGYKKIQFCGEQAKRDRLRHFWVDTCCINKSNQVELQEAINSMFRWYESAVQCYVYLSDVSTGEREVNDERSGIGWEPAFRASRWFTRGWTLQELLAPRSVQFYSSEGIFLGDKCALEREISEITELPTSAIPGTNLSQFSVEERFSWAKRRQTTRKEDKAYSLLGILGLFMSLNYGEGEENAFRRLQKKIKSTREDQECIKHLRVTDPHDDKKRIEDTKGGLLKDSYRWVFYNTNFQQWRGGQQGRLLWIKGDPGKGKTMLLCGIADELRKSLGETELLSYFFCQATDARINSATAVLRGLLYMLVIQQPLLILHIRKKHDDAGRALFEDANAWVALSEIFTNVLHDPSLGDTYIIIDALDECIVDQKKLLDFIVQQSSASRIKWVISSRNWPDIEERLAKAREGTRLSLELNADSVSAAVDFFIKEKVRQLSQDKNYDTKTAEAVQQHLSLNANGTFLWVALVCQNLKDTAKRNVVRKLSAFPPDLGSLYKRMMEQISSSDDADVCKEILALAATVYRPLNLEELVALVEQLEEEADDLLAVQDIISHCGSFLTLRENTVYFVHQSAKDFLLDKAMDDIFPCGREEVNRAIFSRSLQVMSFTLHRDLYSVHNPGCLIDQVTPPDPDPLRASRYSCIYWIDHLCDLSSPFYKEESFGPLVRDSITTFVRQKYLYWLEALSLCKALPRGVVSMTRLEAAIKDIADTSELHQLVQDACRFIMYHKGAIESAPLQAYMSALVFSPTGSLIRNLFGHEAPKGIVVQPSMTNDWSDCLQTLEGHSNDVRSVAFSHDATQLASASVDKMIKIWDASSGACLQTLEGHSDEVNSVAYSYNSTQLASASNDKTVKIWDLGSRACIKTLKRHGNTVRSVAFSHDATQLASASDDNTVKIWDASSGACLQTLEGHSHLVSSVAYSHDSTYLASASFDGTRLGEVSGFLP